MKKLIGALAAAGLILALAVPALAINIKDGKVYVCHAAGQVGTDKFVTLEVPANDGGFPQGHFTENGTTESGHEDDYLGPCRVEVSPSPSISPSPSGEPTPTPDVTPSPTPSATPTITPTPSPSPSGSPMNTPTPSGTPTGSPSSTPPVGSTSPLPTPPATDTAAESLEMAGNGMTVILVVVFLAAVILGYRWFTKPV